jgi:hypothetical protein
VQQTSRCTPGELLGACLHALAGAAAMAAACTGLNAAAQRMFPLPGGEALKLAWAAASALAGVGVYLLAIAGMRRLAPGHDPAADFFSLARQLFSRESGLGS